MSISPNKKLVWVDIESLGLQIGYHDFFEIHMIKEGCGEKTIWLQVDLTKADPDALRINHYYRRQEEGYRLYLMEPKEAAFLIAEWTTDCTLAGNNVGRFDAPMIAAFLKKNGLVPAWDHRVLDSVDYAAGALGLVHPWKSRDVSAALGIAPPTEEEAHTAAADARWAKKLYETALVFAATKKEVAKS